jgi:hypothetical protein
MNKLIPHFRHLFSMDLSIFDKKLSNKCGKIWFLQHFFYRGFTFLFIFDVSQICCYLVMIPTWASAGVMLEEREVWMFSRSLFWL